MRIVAAFAFILLACTAAEAGERPAAAIEVIEAHGFIFRDKTDAVASTSVIHLAENRVEADVTVSQSGEDGTVTKFVLQPAVFQKIAEEAEPYLILAGRGRKFTETIEIDPSVTIEIANDGEFSLAIRMADGGGKTVVYTGDKIGWLVDNALHAESVATSWVNEMLCASVAPAKPARPERPARPPRPGRPAIAEPEAPTGEAFTVSEVSLMPSGVSGFTKIQGRITNNSGRSYPFAVFKLSFFGGANQFIGATDLILQDFKAGETATFEDITQSDLTGWARYEIRLDGGF